jgi:hypothetical protein
VEKPYTLNISFFPFDLSLYLQIIVLSLKIYMKLRRVRISSGFTGLDFKPSSLASTPSGFLGIRITGLLQLGVTLIYRSAFIAPLVAR